MANFLVLFICLLSPFLSFSQDISKGVYLGYEQTPFCYTQKCSLIHDTLPKIEKEKWYFKVTLSVTDSIISLSKIPSISIKTASQISIRQRVDIICTI